MAVRYLTLGEISALYFRVIRIGGGETGIRDLGALQSALAQPRQTFAGRELHPGLAAEAGALAYRLAKNNPIVGRSKRVVHAAMQVSLALNGYEVRAGPEEQEEVVLRLASGAVGREELTEWIEIHLVKRER